jgi:hypothetical protein
MAERMNEVSFVGLDESRGKISFLSSPVSLNQSSLVDIRRNLLDLKEDRYRVLEREKELASLYNQHLLSEEAKLTKPVFQSQHEKTLDESKISDLLLE